MQSHPLHKMHFGPYQALPAALGWPGDGCCMQVCFSPEKVGRLLAKAMWSKLLPLF